jgi:hypothetical protein
VIWDEKLFWPTSQIAYPKSRAFRASNLSWEVLDGTAEPERFFGKSSYQIALGREDTPDHTEQFHQD